MYFDIFNGDADGIFALHQLRLAEPRPDAMLITGVKRDIRLLARPELAEISNCSLTVLDISLDSNREPLGDLLDRDNRVTYFDHHAADPVPDSPLLSATILLGADTCTSLLVNRALAGRFAAWAVCGAFGDNLHQQARQLAQSLALDETAINRLREIGELFNYNGYGATIEDLHYHPLALYRAVLAYADPLDFYASSSEMAVLRSGYASDMELALASREYPNSSKNRVYLLPDAPWARRIAGVFANLKAREKPEAAHALITENRDGSLRVSVRAPLAEPRDAAALCTLFPSGGGRAASAGINKLPADQLEPFLAAFNRIYP